MQIYGSAFGNGKLVTIDSCYDGSEIPHTTVTTDGINFTSYNNHDMCSRGDFWSGIAFINGYFYAYHSANLGSRMEVVVRSTDGKNWTQVATSCDLDTIGLTVTGPDGAGYTFRSGTIYKSTNGINWTAIATVSITDWTASFGYCNGVFIVSNMSGTICTSSDAVHWTTCSSPALCPANNTSEFLSVRGDGYISRGGTVGPSDYVVQQVGSLSITYDYTQFSEGINFLNSSGNSIGNISMVSPSMVSYALTCVQGSTTLFNSSSATKYYHLRGLEHYSGGSWVAEEANEFVKFVSISLSYKKLGDSSVTTVTNITSIKWAASYLTVVQNRTTSITFTNDMFFSSFSLSFTPVGRLRGNYSESLFPALEPDERGSSQITLGTSANPFDEVHSDKLMGELHGNVQGNVSGNLSGNVNGNLTGNVTGDVTGNVNSAGTTKKVYGAVWN